MKKMFSMLVIMALCLNMMAQGISFTEKNWNDVLAEAKAQNKIVFVDAYTTWCGPCKTMAAMVFPETKVGAFYNATFINAKIDMEKGEGVDIAKKYNVNSYPTFLFINGDGELVHRAAGSRPPEDFIALGEAANDPTMQLMGLEQQYSEGERSANFMTKYAAALGDAGMNVSKVSDEYLSSLTNYDSPDVMDFIYETTERPSQKGFQIMADNLEAYYSIFGKNKVQNKMDYALQQLYFSDLEKMAAAYKQYFPKDANRLIAKHKVSYYVYSNREDAVELFIKAAVDYLDNYETNNWQELNSIAWQFYEVSDDKELLTKAVKWAEKSVKMKSDYMNTDTVAALYFKLENKKKAKKWAEIAIAHAAKSGEDASTTKELLKQIEAL